MAVTDPVPPIDLKSINAEYRQRSWGTIFAIAFCLIWGVGWTYFSYFQKSAVNESPPQWARYLLGLAGPLVLGFAVYLYRFYLNDRFIIRDGELIHFGAGDTLKFRIPLSDITSVKESDSWGEGWECWVEYGGSKTFHLTNSLKEYREFAAVLQRISDYNWHVRRQNAGWIGDPLA